MLGGDEGYSFLYGERASSGCEALTLGVGARFQRIAMDRNVGLSAWLHVQSF